MTADELALLRGVEAAPDDDLPRLVYADWLDEHGRHARAEFIRVQCELASIERRLPTMTVAEKRVEGPRRAKLKHTQRDMLRSEPFRSLGLPEGDWPNDLSEWWECGQGIANCYSRGFLGELNLYASSSSFEFTMQLCNDMIPRPRIGVTCMDAMLWGAHSRDIFSHAGAWASVRDLHLRGGDDPQQNLLPHELIPMMQPDYPSLQVFTLCYNRITPGHVCVISERLKAPNLERLALAHNQIVDSGVQFLHRAIYARSLQEIDLSHNPLCRPESSTLTRQRFPSLRHIDLSNCPIMPQSLAQLRAQLPGVEVIC